MIPSNNNPNPAAPAVISTADYHLSNGTYLLCYINFDSNSIETLVTPSPSIVDSWLFQIPHRYTHPYPLRYLPVGLDVEWHPNFNRGQNNPVATIQLCIGYHCLVFQIYQARLLFADPIPASLVAFLSNPNHKFFGVGIQDDANKLLRDYNLRVGNCVDLRTLAVDFMGDPAMRNAGLRTLCQRVIGRDVEKPRRITMSEWNNRWLSGEQVQYAAVDAFLSSEIGIRIFPIPFY